MHPTVANFLRRLSYGENIKDIETERSGVVQTLARVYEKARNAMEYRADHLVRRAAIERILKRQSVFSSDPGTVAKQLLDELKWARYVAAAELDHMPLSKLETILAKYLQPSDTPKDWILGVASAEIEEGLNLNVDYNVFTAFTYQVLRQKIKVSSIPDIDLMLFVAVDKVYSQSDEQQIAYHVLQLVQKQNIPDFKEVLAIAYDQTKSISKNKQLGRLSNFIRRQAVPLVLLRDMYFSDPSEFKNLFNDQAIFDKKAKEVLEVQLKKMSQRIQTAAFRSITYVFLTKMLVGLVIEAPLDIFLTGHIGYLALIINLAFPPLTMWAMSLNISLPKPKDQQSLIGRSWQIVSDFGSLATESDYFSDNTEIKKGWWYFAFSIIYASVFALIFGLIFLGLNKLHFSLVSQAIFVFFLSIVAFFAYRIRQTARIYSFSVQTSSSLWDMVLLPILAMGNIFSQGLSRLNFLAFAFDFILEAPFKLILQFLDNWVQFLSLKKEEVIG